MPINDFVRIVICLCLVCTVELVSAQSETDWSGELELTADYATGNSEYSNLGFSIEAFYDLEFFRHSFNFNIDYAESGKIAEKNTIELGYQVSRELSDRFYWYGQLAAEREEFPVGYDADFEETFSALEYRGLVSVGLGAYLIDTDTRAWVIEGGPGSRYTRFKEIGSRGSDFVDETREYAFYAASEFDQSLRDDLLFEHDLTTTHTKTSTSVISIFALTLQLVANLAGKISHRTDFESDPPLGIEDTDNLLEMSLLVGF